MADPHCPEACGCCEPATAATPALIDNRPGLSAISYRVGTFSAFRRAMLEAIAREPALRGLTTRRSDDPAITLLELWSAVADVLTFYQERIANEAYLRTATERDSVLRLVRLIDYQLQPGLAATAQLIFTLDEGATTVIPTRLRVMSVPGQDELPQTFETIETVTADARLNRVRVFPVPTAYNPFGQGATSAVLLAGPSLLGANDRLVFFSAGRLEEKTVSSLMNTDTGQELSWTPPVQAGDMTARTAHAGKVVRTLRFFGYNAPTSYMEFVPGSTTAGDKWESKSNTFNLGGDLSTYALDARYEDLKPGAMLLVDTGESTEPMRLVTVTASRQNTATKGQLEDTVTEVSVTRMLRDAPAVCSWGVNRLDVFARSGEDTCLRAWYSGSWGSWQSLGGQLTSAPAAVSRATNRIDLFARGIDDALWHRSWNGTAWSNWQTLGGTLTAAPAVASSGTNRLEVFARGTDRALWYRSWNGTTWSPWQSLGGTLASAPAAVSWGANRIDVFARGKDDDLQHIYWNGTTWSSWESLGGELIGAPSVASTASGRLDVFKRGRDDALWRLSWNGTAWSTWESLGGVLTSDPAAVSWGSNRIDVFARGADNGLQQKSWTGTSWTGWSPISIGIGAISDIRKARVYQLESPELRFRLYGYTSQITGGRLAVPLAQLDAIETGRAILLEDSTSPPISAKVTGTELLSAASIDAPDHLAIDFAPSLSAPLETASAVLLGNVVQATHGETIADEILGDGDASIPFQRFMLRKKPLTYVPSSTRVEGESTLSLFVNGEQWTEVDSLYNQPTTARVYTVHHADDGSTVIQGGDGITAGVRFPSGRGNVVATYRQGSGLDGRVKAGQLSIPLDRPVGLKTVTNTAAEGGANPEPLSQARANAPTTVKTFGRAVALRDFEALAMSSGEVAKASATVVWLGLERAVHLTVAGQDGSVFSTAALERLHSALTTQRDPNQPLMLDNVRRVPIVFEATIQVEGQFVRADVLAAARSALVEFFSFRAMDFAAPIHLSAVYQVLQDVNGVLSVDIDKLLFKQPESMTAAEFDADLRRRGVQFQVIGGVEQPLPVQPHLHIFPAHAEAGTPPNVIPAEQAYIEDESRDIVLTASGGLA